MTRPAPMLKEQHPELFDRAERSRSPEPFPATSPTDLDTLAAWLGAYSTSAPFGSEAPPATHYFGVQEPAVHELRGGGPPALQFTHDVMGLTAHETLFAVGQTVVGVSTVDFGGENLLPAYRQVKSSLLPANTSAPAAKTEVRSVLALADVLIYRGPGGCVFIRINRKRQFPETPAYHP